MHEEDLKAYWQQRDVERPRMSIEQLRDRAVTFQKYVRTRDLIEYVACAVVVVGSGFYLWAFPGFLLKLGSLAMIAATLFVAYQLRKHGAARALSPESPAASLLEFHRKELVRRRDLLKNSWRLFVGPLMLGMLVFLAGLAPQRPEGKLPLFIFGAAVIAMGVAISLYNRWQADRLQRDIDNLNSLSSAARGADASSVRY
jgi:hypothetical protein